MVATRSFGEGAQFAVLHVGLDLRIPSVGVEIGEPISKCPQLFRTEALYLILDILDPAHPKLHASIIPASGCCTTRYRSRAVNLRTSATTTPSNRLTTRNHLMGGTRCQSACSPYAKHSFIVLMYRRQVSFMSSDEPSCSSDMKPVKPIAFRASAMAWKSITPCPMATYSRIVALMSRM